MRTEFCTYKNCGKPTPKTGGRMCDMHRTRKKKGQDMDAPPLLRPRGTGTVSVYGYVIVYKPEHPNANKSGYMPEHVVIMSEKIGRALLPGENVHHKNGVRSDNRPENLELWVTAQPKGQRPEDLLEWADEIIRRYR